MSNWLATKLPSATPKTAFFAGIWSGTVLFIYWIVETNLLVEGGQSNGFALAAFIGLFPAFPFVFGDKPKHKGFSKEAIVGEFKFMKSAMKRCVFWMLGGGAISVPLSWVAKIAGVGP